MRKVEPDTHTQGNTDTHMHREPERESDTKQDADTHKAGERHTEMEKNHTQKDTKQFVLLMANYIY